MSLDDNSREGTRRTDVLTSATANTGRLVDNRHHGRLLIVLVEHDHLDGPCRTVTGTVAAVHTVGQRNAVLLNPYGMTNLKGGLFNAIKWFNSPCRTDIGTARTLWTTIAALVGHDG